MITSLDRRQKIAIFAQAFSSGLPLALVTSTLQTWYSISGASLYFVSLLALIGQPYTYKFLWAPLLDHYYLTRFGKTKTWLFITQTSLIVIIFMMAWMNPQRDPHLLAGLALAAAFFSASQDIVVDGHRVALLTPQTNAQGTLLYLIGFRLAFVLASSATLIFADHFGWRLTYISMAGLLMPVWLTTLMLHYSTVVQNTVQKMSLRSNYARPLKNLIKKPYFGLMLFFMMSYGLGDTFIASLSHIYLLSYLKLSLTWLGIANKSMNILGLFGSTLLAGFILQRYDIYRCLKWFGYLQGLTIIIFYVSVQFRAEAQLQILWLTLETFAGGMCAFVIYALINNFCDKKYSFVHYTLLNSAINGLRLLLMPGIGFIASAYGWQVLFALGVLMTIPGLVALPLLAKKFAWINVKPDQLPLDATLIEETT